MTFKCNSYPFSNSKGTRKHPRKYIKVGHLKQRFECQRTSVIFLPARSTCLLLHRGHGRTPLVLPKSRAPLSTSEPMCPSKTNCHRHQHQLDSEIWLRRKRNASSYAMNQTNLSVQVPAIGEQSIESLLQSCVQDARVVPDLDNLVGSEW